jgi:hypothetical protein
VDTGVPDRVEAVDRAGQFALQRPQLVDVLDERGGTQCVLIVEDLVAHRALSRETFRREPHARIAHLRAGDIDSPAIRRELVADPGLGQSVGDRRCIGCGQIGIEERALFRAGAHHDEQQPSDNEAGDAKGGQQPHGPCLPDDLRQPLQTGFSAPTGKGRLRIGGRPLPHWAIFSGQAVNARLMKCLPRSSYRYA